MILCVVRGPIEGVIRPGLEIGIVTEGSPTDTTVVRAKLFHIKFHRVKWCIASLCRSKGAYSIICSAV